MGFLQTLYKRTLLSAYLVLEQNLLAQQNVRVPEEEEIMNDPGGVAEYQRAMDDDYGATYNLILSKISKILPLEGRGLEVGCGPAILTAKLAAAFPGIEWFGIDASDSMLALAAARKARRSLANLHFKKLDYRALDSLEETFDFICISLTLHHVRSEADAVELIVLCKKRLKPGGILLVFDFIRPKTDDIAVQICDIYIRSLGQMVCDDALASFRAAFSFSEVEEILKRASFTNYEHARDVLGIYQFVCTKAPRLRSSLPLHKSLGERLATFWHRTLFLWKM
jgi:SAM-dependent methyltransferase